MQSPITNFARVLNQIAEKNGEGAEDSGRGLILIPVLQAENASRDPSKAA